MSHQFKPGDLALIVGARRLAENIGKECTVVRFLHNGEFYFFQDGTRFIRSDGAWLICGEGVTGLAFDCLRWTVDRVSGIGLVDSRHLIPLKGDFDSDQQKAKEADPCA